MFGYDPAATLAAIVAPITALVADDDEGHARAAALAQASAARVAAGRDPIRCLSVGPAGHNLMRYRPDSVGSAILSVVEPLVVQNP
jgi:hypothetical protein